MPRIKNTFGVALTGGLLKANTDRLRSDRDFYPTPPDATTALMLAHDLSETVVWEPACGNGSMARVIANHCKRVYCSDIEPQMEADRLDFLTVEAMPDGSEAIITNPPFAIAEAFIEHAFRLQPRFFALLLKSQFWHAAKRLAVFEAWPPSIVHPLTWRPDFLGIGSSVLDVAWTVWEADAPPLGKTRFLPLQKPDCSAGARKFSNKVAEKMVKTGSRSDREGNNGIDVVDEMFGG